MKHSAAFTLIELLVALVVITMLVAGLALPISAQVQLRRQDETRRTLEEAREALLGFAAGAARLPCPATATSHGEEAFAPGGDASNGRCATFHDGWLPAAALGLTPLDEAAFLRDAWGTRIRYAVFGDRPIEGVEHALTRARGLQAATLPGLGAAPHYLIICASGQGLDAASCGAAANQLTRRAAFVVFSTGPNGGGIPGPDETHNLDGDGVFVSHTASQDPVNPFDDLVTWLPVPMLINRMIAAGHLP
ncbi:type II secretion system protein [Usitatibacter palustris]|uniref:Prepilin-type N-terminal cleavage/methylation domain-containing protein n=1 Tax=Usitatibacter palustris TaxID=2732487 RepID=A0A6M4H9H1_9PROT|nr:prepilin-type N-terminal cleavage/methylation domain-containing protein [Usitatibacter palustris]QJR16399.1 hypothetical protein DSM104440_03233 [Usitatibacter palustris]